MKLRTWSATLACALLLASASWGATPEAERRAMVESLRLRGIRDGRVLEAMLESPRHLFVGSEYLHQAYQDREIPIGAGQVICRPYAVALTTQLARLRPSDVVLEVGTGSGYHAAVLSRLCRQVYTIEIVPSLARSARERLRRLGYYRVTTKQGDGYQGWSEFAPYDVIIVTCAADRVPVPLVEQLREGGRLVIPVSDRGEQTLTLMEKTGGRLRAVSVVKAKFSPMTH